MVPGHYDSQARVSLHGAHECPQHHEHILLSEIACRQKIWEATDAGHKLYGHSSSLCCRCGRRDAEHFAHAMGTDDPFRSKAEALLLTLLEVGCGTAPSRVCCSVRVRADARPKTRHCERTQQHVDACRVTGSCWGRWSSACCKQPAQRPRLGPPQNQPSPTVRSGLSQSTYWPSLILY